MLKNKREGYLIALVLIALYFSLLENLIPKPFPWMKIGLANLATIIALEKFDKKMAFEVVGLRIIIQGLMLGTLFTPGFFVSLTAGTASTVVMVFLYNFRKNLSLMAISSFSAVVHNITQLFVVYFLMFRNIDVYTKSILSFVLLFLALGWLSGMVTGYLGERLNLRRRIRN
ncbi:Gx transporter family protein [Ilyobacter polytropus]|uniref:Heptaprenyl diphosphate synthase component I n=1 Tax=Ilyobacter polytropus (strain ATCC 51220 / DSM 2926 / LMG 16218 / CuHBu1) TaxID=572544 RepID=E3H890_ILYPC|nr:Gx transporter family protein [Ilyobacter polytropus]ADO81986.1 Heptaprenyl diphosphate synthase component I [Ilyobacter polytropus DSM 2926]